jgi:hypothetical protein
MVDTITVYTFRDWFLKHRENNFSYDGLTALYEYLTNLEDDIGEQIEFDPIAICCDYTEYKNLDEIKKEYDDIKTIEDLEDNTSVIQFDEGLIIQAY